MWSRITPEGQERHPWEKVDTMTVCTIPLSFGPGANSWRALRRHLLEHGVAEELRFSHRSVVWDANVGRTSFILVTSGVVKVVLPDISGYQGLTELVLTGEVGNFPCMGAGEGWTSEGFALSAGRFLIADSDQICTIARESTEICGLLAGLAWIQAVRLRMRVSAMTSNSVPSRLSWHLIWLCRRVGLKDARGVFIPVRLTRRDLAGLVGCRVETSIRILGRWVEEGLLAFLREGIVVYKLEALSAHWAQLQQQPVASDE